MSTPMAMSKCRRDQGSATNRTGRSWSNTGCPEPTSSLLRAVLACILGSRRSILRRCRGGFLLLVVRHLFLQIVDDLLQCDDAAFQALDLPVGGIEFLLMVQGELADSLLQEIDIALQAG